MTFPNPQLPRRSLAVIAGSGLIPHVAAPAAAQAEQSAPRGRLIAYVGGYSSATDPEAGGITVVEVGDAGRSLTAKGKAAQPRNAGYLVYAPSTRTLYAVDERKTDGRGPVGPAAMVHALRAADDGGLTPLNAELAPGPNPTYLAHDERRRLLVSANHGDFDHVERVVRGADGQWRAEYVYDDSAVLVYGLKQDGSLAGLRDVHVMAGHGPDPNSSSQSGGHAQASPHAHSAVFDPTGRFLLVADKGTDHVHTFSLEQGLEPVSSHRFPPETGPRHIAFDPVSGYGFLTCEFASDLVSFAFDADAGKLAELDRVRTVEVGYAGTNEPADVRVHPRGGHVYVNNRGEDSLAWFEIGAGGALTRRGMVELAASLHPGVAARSFAFAPSGEFLLVADRPAGVVRSYAVNQADGALTPLTQVQVPEAAFVAFAELPG